MKNIYELLKDLTVSLLYNSEHTTLEQAPDCQEAVTGLFQCEASKENKLIVSLALKMIERWSCLPHTSIRTELMKLQERFQPDSPEKELFEVMFRTT